MTTKSNVLALLEQARGESISGEDIGNTLQVSRNAVWKAIKQLRNEGYIIHAITNKGYTLDTSNDFLSMGELFPHLTSEIDKDNIHILDEVESTNKIAKEFVVTDPKHGKIILADSQTKGYGRFQRSFYSPAANGIYMSLILQRKQLSFEQPTIITFLSAIAVCDAIEELTDKRPVIKWINDIYLDKKKICGILTEATMDFESNTIDWIVVGMGINFKGESFPKELEKKAGSIFGKELPNITRSELIANIINKIFKYFKEYTVEQILDSYKQRLFIIDREIKVKEGKNIYQAIALDIDKEGKLLVKRLDNGLHVLVSAGEIEI